MNSQQETASYEPSTKAQLETFRRYRGRLEALYDSKVRVSALNAKEGNKVSQGFRISLSEAPMTDFSRAIITDWDDTIENYSQRKPKYYTALYGLVLETYKGKMSESEFQAICLEINRHARALNPQKHHPAQYSPLLEMVAESRLFELLSKEDVAEHEKSSLQRLLADPKGQARAFLQSQVLFKFGGYLTDDEDKEKGKPYFFEKQHQSLATTFDTPSPIVNEQVWNLFVTEMTKPALSPQDVENIDLQDSDYWVISTFGGIEFQLEKVLQSLEHLKKQGKRMPNEIIITTRGRKSPFIHELVAEGDHMEWWFLDDSGRQFEELSEDPNLHPVRARRPGTKRYDDPSIEGVPEFDMDGPLSKVFELQSNTMGQ